MGIRAAKLSNPHSPSLSQNLRLEIFCKYSRYYVRHSKINQIFQSIRGSHVFSSTANTPFIYECWVFIFTEFASSTEISNPCSLSRIKGNGHSSAGGTDATDAGESQDGRGCSMAATTTDDFTLQASARGDTGTHSTNNFNNRLSRLG